MPDMPIQKYKPLFPQQTQCSRQEEQSTETPLEFMNAISVYHGHLCSDTERLQAERYVKCQLQLFTPENNFVSSGP